MLFSSFFNSSNCFEINQALKKLDIEEHALKLL